MVVGKKDVTEVVPRILACFSNSDLDSHLRDNVPAAENVRLSIVYIHGEDSILNKE